MQTALDKHAPIKIKKISSNKKRVPWFNSEISIAIRDQRRAERKWYKNTNDPGLFMDFYHARQAVSNLMDSAEKKYYHDMLFENRHNPKEVFHICNSLLGRNQESPMPPGFTDSQLAENFNNFFVTKTAKIMTVLHGNIANMPPHPQPETVLQLPPKLGKFRVLTDDEVARIIRKSPSKCCVSDLVDTGLLKDVLPCVRSCGHRSTKGCITCSFTLTYQTCQQLNAVWHFP